VLPQFYKKPKFKVHFGTPGHCLSTNNDIVYIKKRFSCRAKKQNIVVGHYGLIEPDLISGDDTTAQLSLYHFQMWQLVVVGCRVNYVLYLQEFFNATGSGRPHSGSFGRGFSRFFDNNVHTIAITSCLCVVPKVTSTQLLKSLIY